MFLGAEVGRGLDVFEKMKGEEIGREFKMIEKK